MGWKLMWALKIYRGTDYRLFIVLSSQKGQVQRRLQIFIHREVSDKNIMN